LAERAFDLVNCFLSVVGFYNADFIRRNIYRPTETDETNRNPTPVASLTIAYIKGTSETISRINSIRVAHNPATTGMNPAYVFILYDNSYSRITNR